MVPKREDHTQREKTAAGNSGGMLVPNQEIANCSTFAFLTISPSMSNVTRYY